LRQRPAADFAPVGYFGFDPQGLILEANLTGASMLGIDAPPNPVNS
jgi:hypothetical protein